MSAVAAVLLLGGALAGCSSDDSGTGGADGAPGRPDTDGTQDREDSAPDGQEDSADTETDTDGDGADGHATITSHGLADHDTWGPGSYVVAYEITNEGEDTASYFVQLEFLDSDGDLVGSTGVTADRLGPTKSSSGETAPLEVELGAGTVADITDVRIGQVMRTPAP